MKIVPTSETPFLFKVRSDGNSNLEGFESLNTPESEDSSEPMQWLPVASPGPPEDTAGKHPWDIAHEMVQYPPQGGLNADDVKYVEPDFTQEYPIQPPPSASGDGFESSSQSDPCTLKGMDQDFPTGNFEFGWHLNDDYTQLRAARNELGDPGDGNRIRVGILDTGIDPNHSSLPRHMRMDLARNFDAFFPNRDVVDPESSLPGTNPGHGTATLALLAGNKITPTLLPGSSITAPGFPDFLGGAPHVEVVPIRISDSVIHVKSSSMAKGIRYAAEIGCQVLSISMGGVPTQAWAEAVNFAYFHHGMAIFAAAGNRIGPAFPKTLVYPARLGRVVAVCGFNAAKRPYFIEGTHTKMHGCFGPPEAMRTAIAAYTPNIPWANIGCPDVINPDGAGTSSATPQAAAAAALWLQKHRPTHSDKWRIVEGIRKALFKTADESPSHGFNWYGNGLLRAKDALGIDFDSSLSKTPKDVISFNWVGWPDGFESTGAPPENIQQMLETEALQVYLQSPGLQNISGGADPQHDTLERSTQKAFLKALSEHPSASKTLRTHATKVESQL